MEEFNNIDQEANDKLFLDTLPEIEIKYSKSKEQVWLEMQDKMNETKQFNLVSKVKYLVAACVGILIASSIFISLQSVNVYCPKAERLSHILPDNSIVELNAHTKISYNKFLWKFRRKLNLNGEAFFKVTKGSKFSVYSDKAVTSVLGTSFNIYSRDSKYNVTCYTGKVSVESLVNNKKEIIKPQEKIILTEKSELKHSNLASPEKTAVWTKNKFQFTNQNLIDVINELNIQYDVDIQLKTKEEYLYTGNFDKTESVDEILHLVCKTFGLVFDKQKNGKFIIESAGA
ncbi:MAG: FecR family protein [Marinifilaceae bacterium]|jgi:ferric-dicitrate binding protein FerR (iron transport regulator)|nr:FecR family protein [Marinifilaceae bacterium]